DASGAIVYIASAARSTVVMATASGAGNQASCSGWLHNRPTTACSDTSHHNRQRVAADSAGSARHSRYTSATSSTVCRLVQPSRSSIGINIEVSMAQSSWRRDCSSATSASSSASSLSLTFCRCDRYATNGDTEPCSVLSTNWATAPCSTLSGPRVGW